MSTLTAVVATSRAALAEAWANRAGFWMQAMAMVVNDLVWVIFWVLFFHRVGTLRGWNTDGVLLLQAALTTSGGFAVLGWATFTLGLRRYSSGAIWTRA